jgi:molybdopterin converting factor small subunit
MKIQVQLFANLRECLPDHAERGRAVVEILDGSSLRDLFDHLGVDQCLGQNISLADQIESWQLSVNGEFTQDLDRVLMDRDQVIVFPHMAGG